MKGWTIWHPKLAEILFLCNQHQGCGLLLTVFNISEQLIRLKVLLGISWNGPKNRYVASLFTVRGSLVTLELPGLFVFHQYLSIIMDFIASLLESLWWAFM